MLESMRVNLNARKARRKNISVNIRVTDAKEKLNYTLRNQIAVFSDSYKKNADVTLVGTKGEILKYFSEGKAPKNKVKGSRKALKSFFASFDKPNANTINLLLPNNLEKTSLSH